MTLKHVLYALVLTLRFARPGAASDQASSLELGYRFMYGLDFPSAACVFLEWRAEHPRDPLAPISLAANLLFAELYRSGVLQAQFLVDDRAFTALTPSAPPPGLRERFDAAIADAEALARVRLGEDPDDRDALFALAMAFGLRADFAGLVEGRKTVALSYTREASRLSHTLIALAPDYADAYLAIGISQFIVGSLIAPMRWALRIAGFDGDKDQGMRELRIAADHGRLMGPFARILLAIACVRQHDKAGARELLAGLAHDFPSNPLFARELQRISVKSH